MTEIIIKNVTKNNLKDFSVHIPLQKLVAIVGPSGSGKSTIVQEVLYNNSKNHVWDIKNLPKKIHILEQKVTLPASSKQSLGQYNFEKLTKILSEIEKSDLLIVDEPCAGYCEKERLTIFKLLKDKVKKGFSIIAVEHNKEIIANADYIIELGPGAGRYGGKLIFEGPLSKFKKSGTITAKHVFEKAKAPKQEASSIKSKFLTLSNINSGNFNKYSFTFPLTKLVCLTGPSGSGKSTLLDVTYRTLFKGRNAHKIRLKTVKVEGKSAVRRSYIVPSSPIGNHHSSTLATYAKVWDNIREIFAKEKTAKKLELKKSDFIVSKDIIENKKDFSPDSLKVTFKSKTIKDIFNMTIDEALEVFNSNSLIVRKLKFLEEVGLGYLVLGQKSSSLSGGEAQRVRIANILSKKLGDRSVYIFDTPTRGLHLNDIPVLINVFRKIINKNNTILIADNREEIFNFCDTKINL